MFITVPGFVKNGVVVPEAPLPEGAQVEIRLNESQVDVPPKGKEELEAGPQGNGPTPAELRRMPREQRQAILAAAAEMAEPDYRTDKELTGFQAFSEEEADDDESDPIAGRGLADQV